LFALSVIRFFSGLNGKVAIEVADGASRNGTAHLTPAVAVSLIVSERNGGGMSELAQDIAISFGILWVVLLVLPAFLSEHFGWSGPPGTLSPLKPLNEKLRSANMPSPTEDYRLNAEACSRMAGATPQGVNKRWFEQVAEQWLRMAEASEA
jgi:hypothetical protein